MDNVLENFTQHLIEDIYNDIYDDNLTVDSIKSWNMHEYVKPECGKDIYGCITDKMILGLKPLLYAQEITKKLIEEGYDLYIVTATQSNFVVSKQYWIDKHFPWLSNKLIITNYKSLCSGLDVLIDDQPRNIELFPNEVIIMDYAWNRELKRDCPRAKNWQDIYRIIHEIDENNNRKSSAELRKKPEIDDASAEKINSVIKDNNRKISDALLNVRRIAQEQMKKHKQTFDDAKNLFDWKHE